MPRGQGLAICFMDAASSELGTFQAIWGTICTCKAPFCMVNIVHIDPLQILVGVGIDLVVPKYGPADLRVKPPCVQ
jgi:hypothetical protein